MDIRLAPEAQRIFVLHVCRDAIEPGIKPSELVAKVERHFSLPLPLL